MYRGRRHRRKKIIRYTTSLIILAIIVAGVSYFYTNKVLNTKTSSEPYHITQDERVKRFDEFSIRNKFYINETYPQVQEVYVEDVENLDKPVDTVIITLSDKVLDLPTSQRKDLASRIGNGIIVSGIKTDFFSSATVKFKTENNSWSYTYK